MLTRTIQIDQKIEFYSGNQQQVQAAIQRDIETFPRWVIQDMNVIFGTNVLAWVLWRKETDVV